MTAMDTLARLSAASLGRLLQAGDLDAVAVAEWFLEAIEARPDDKVFITVTRERALREAAAAARRLKEGRPASALDGVPLAWKDLVDLEGTVTTAASDLYRDAPPAKTDAPIAVNLADAGMVVLGKANLSEFAYSGLGINMHFGTPANPHDKATPRVPGGSSSGSAVAVAAGLAPIAIGSDTGGSVRIPASLNGLVGYKSTESRIDKTSVFPLSYTLDTIGPLARSVEDCILIDMALRRAATSPIARAGLSGLELAVPENVVFEGVEEAVAANFENSLGRLSAAGARVTRRHFPAFDEMQRITVENGTLTAAEAYHIHRVAMAGPDRARIDQRIVSRIARAETMTALDTITIVESRKSLQRELYAALDGALLVFPTTPHAAPAIAPLEADEELYHATNLKTLRNTMIGNFFRTCGLALPNGFDGGGLPTSILFSAPGGEDERLLSYGLEIERVLAS